MSEGLYFYPDEGTYLINSTINILAYQGWNFSTISSYSFKFALYDTSIGSWRTNLNHTGVVCTLESYNGTNERLRIKVNVVDNILSLYPSISQNNITKLAFYNGTIKREDSSIDTFGYGDSIWYSDPQYTLGHYSVCTSPTSVLINDSTSNIQTGYDTIKVTCKGAKNGSYNSISSYYIQYCDSTDGITWGTWIDLLNMTTSEASSGYVAESPGLNCFRKFRIKSKGKIAGYDATTWTESPTVQKLQFTNCTPPAECILSSTLSFSPVKLEWSGATGGVVNEIIGYNVQYCESADNITWGDWSDLLYSETTSVSVSPPPTIGNYYKFRIQSCGEAGEMYYSDWYECPDTLQKKESLLSNFTDLEIIKGVTKIKAIHMTEMQNYINTLLVDKGLDAISFTEIIAKQTKLSGWIDHVNEIRDAVDLLGRSHEDWVELSGALPRANAISQLQDIVIGYSKVILTVSGEEGLPSDCIVSLINTDDGSVIERFKYTETSIIKILPDISYRIECSPSSKYNVAPVSEVIISRACEISYITLNYRNAYRYGFKREKANSDPSTRITYLYDAEDMTPMSVNLTTGEPDYGSWQTFIEEVCRPVMLKYDGSVDYELDHNDQTKKMDGTASDIANTAYEGNAMVEFRKYKWVKRYEDEQYEYVIFSDVQWDDTYNSYAFTNEDGAISDVMYFGMFKGRVISSKLRSIGTGAITTGNTMTKERQYAEANGSGYDITSKCMRDYICDILTLLSKNDSSDVFGFGVINASSRLAVGSLISQGAFYGKNTNKTTDIKTLYIEGFWGNVAERLNGLFYSSSKNGFIVKMTPPYNTTGDGYFETGISFSSDLSDSYMTTSSCTDVGGWLPTAGGGQNGTYTSDGLWITRSVVGCPRVGGNYNTGTTAGARTLILNHPHTTATEWCAARLTYIPTINS